MFFHIFFSQEELATEVSPGRQKGIVQDKLFTACEYDVLSNFNSKSSQTTYEDSALGLLSDSFNTQCTDVSAPSIFDLIIINVELSVNRWSLIVTHVNFFYDSCLNLFNLDNFFFIIGPLAKVAFQFKSTLVLERRR
jgi:hypothetical protein